jgi:hypothetical protein
MRVLANHLLEAQAPSLSLNLLWRCYHEGVAIHLQRAEELHDVGDGVPKGHVRSKSDSDPGKQRDGSDGRQINLILCFKGPNHLTSGNVLRRRVMGTPNWRTSRMKLNITGYSSWRNS